VEHKTNYLVCNLQYHENTVFQYSPENGFIMHYSLHIHCHRVFYWVYLVQLLLYELIRTNTLSFLADNFISYYRQWKQKSLLKGWPFPLSRTCNMVHIVGAAISILSLFPPVRQRRQLLLVLDKHRLDNKQIFNSFKQKWNNIISVNASNVKCDRSDDYT